tara:strand:+ start:763 stop:972 length:210 start_codon:yes stop_codon:yes gene_type:complete
MRKRRLLGKINNKKQIKMTALQKEYLEHLMNMRYDFYNRGFMKQAQQVQKDIDNLWYTICFQNQSNPTK